MNDYRPIKKIASLGPARDSTMHPLKKLTATNSNCIVQLLTRVREIEKLTREITIILPNYLMSHCQVANIRGNILILQTESSAWVLRLRYEGPRILEYLKQHGWPELNEVRIRVGSPRLPPPPVKRAVMSAKTIELLHSVAQDCSDPEFRAAWERLANRRS